MDTRFSCSDRGRGARGRGNTSAIGCSTPIAITFTRRNEVRVMNLNLPISLRHSRRLQGDILCDASGRLYERVGQYVQLVHHLVAGPHGEVLNLAPPPSPRSFQRTFSAIDVEEQTAGRELENAPAAQPTTPWREITIASEKPRVVRF